MTRPRDLGPQLLSDKAISDFLEELGLNEPLDYDLIGRWILRFLGATEAVAVNTGSGERSRRHRS